MYFKIAFFDTFRTIINQSTKSEGKKTSCYFGIEINIACDCQVT